MQNVRTFFFSSLLSCEVQRGSKVLDQPKGTWGIFLVRNRCSHSYNNRKFPDEWRPSSQSKRVWDKIKISRLSWSSKTYSSRIVKLPFRKTWQHRSWFRIHVRVNGSNWLCLSAHSPALGISDRSFELRSLRCQDFKDSSDIVFLLCLSPIQYIWLWWIPEFGEFNAAFLGNNSASLIFKVARGVWHLSQQLILSAD